MTSNQLAFWKAQEEARHNRELEKTEASKRALLGAQTEESQASTELKGSQNVYEGTKTANTILGWVGDLVNGVAGTILRTPAKMLGLSLKDIGSASEGASKLLQFI